jgi:phage shock protein A
MGIFDRMGKVISSNVNALLDRFEDPKKLIELDLDETAEQLRRGRQEVVAAVASEKQLRKKVEELEGEVQKWDKRAELALRTGDEALAREALKHKRRVQGDRERAERTRAEQRDTALRMKSELERAEQKLDEWRSRRGTMAAKIQQARGGGGVEALGARGPQTPFEGLRRMEDKIEQRELEATAMAEVDDALGRGPQQQDLEARFRELESTHGSGSGPDVEEELAALRKRVRVGP